MGHKLISGCADVGSTVAVKVGRRTHEALIRSAGFVH